MIFFLLITFDEEDDSDALLELREIFSISSSNGEGVWRVVDRFDLLGLLKSIVSDKELKEARLELTISLILGDGN